MTIRVGIPSALLYFLHYPFWKTFFGQLGAQVITSGSTNKHLVDDGVKESLADACIPVKVFFGHVMSLRDRVDYLFVPRVVCLNGETTYCPKFLGLPDMLKHSLDNIPPIIDVRMDIRENTSPLYKAYYQIGRLLGAGRWAIGRAYRKASAILERFHNLLQKGYHPPEAIMMLEQHKMPPVIKKKEQTTIAVLGYPYAIHDPFISVGLVDKLKRLNIRVITAENLPRRALEKQDCGLEKRMFWTFSETALKAAHFLFEHGGADGIIHLTAFGCGPDSLVDKLMELAAKEYKNMPYMSMTIDEHSGEAGVATRLEAFVDMIRRKSGGGRLA